MCYRTGTISSESVETSKEYYYDINRRFLSWQGQWPFQKPKQRLVIIIFIMIWNFSIIFTQIAKLFVCEDLDCIFQTIPTHLLVLNCVVKILTYQFNIKKMKDLIHRLFVDWNTLETQEDCEIMKKYAEKGRWYSLLYSSYVYVSTISFLTSSLIIPRMLDVIFPLNYSRPLILAYPAYYFVDEERYFCYIFCHLLISGIICLTGLIAHDCMFFTYIQHVCGLFAVVGFKFENMLYARNIEKESLINCLDAVHYRNVVLLVHAHKEALQFVSILENTFSVSLALQLVISTSSLSVTLLQVSTHLHDSTEVIRYSVYAIAQLFHLFCLSFQGQKLIDHSIETCNKIYNGPWYKIPVSVQRQLLMVMRESSKASRLTAGKIYVFSLENFTTVVQTSMSYFTVLSSFNES